MNKKGDKNRKRIENGAHNKTSSNWFSFIKTNNKLLQRALEAEEKVEKTDKKFKLSKKIKLANKPLVTKVLALDCEMVSSINDEDILARVSVVNYKQDCIYDKFVKPDVPVGDYRTRFSGIREKDLENGVAFHVVHKEVKNLLNKKILVGHALENDFRVLKLQHVRMLIRDTSKYEKFRTVSGGKTPALKNLAKMFLDEDIQCGEHNSIEDARTAMRLYIKYRHEWEAFLLKKKKSERTIKNDVSASTTIMIS